MLVVLPSSRIAWALQASASCDLFWYSVASSCTLSSSSWTCLRLCVTKR
uniref:Uncharacterized protein n=1 Tax=Arundo donax TaxID=35708 RepID=A0A0A8Z5L0_ARUDO